MTPAATIRRVYHDTNGFALAGAAPPGIAPLARQARIYGEITSVGARQLIRASGLRAGDRFVDLGSGIGKLALFIALALPDVEVRGIEIDADRHGAASRALTRACALGLVAPGRCSFEHADARTADLSGATVLFANSTCFPDQLVAALARRAAELAPVTFATTKPLTGRAARLFDSLGAKPCAASWDHRMTVSIYRRC